VSVSKLVIGFLALAAAGASAVLLCGPSPALALAPPVGLVLVALIFQMPRLALYLIIGMIPFSALRVLTADYPMLTVSKILGAWLLVWLVLDLVRNKGRLPEFGRQYAAALILLLAIYSLSCLFAVYPLDALNDFRQLTAALLFLVLTVYFLREEHILFAIPFVLVLSASAAAFLAIAGNMFGVQALIVEARDVAGGSRATGPANDPNFFSAMILASLPPLAYFIARQRSPFFRGLLSLVFLHNVYAVLITYSRAGTLVLLLVMLMLAVENFRRLRMKHVPALILAAMGLIVVAIVYLPRSAAFERFATLGTPAADPSLQRRATYLLVARRAFFDDPILGAGPGAFPRLYAKSLYAHAMAETPEDYFRSAHNTYIEILVGSGLAGLIIFGIVLALALRSLFRRPAGDSPGAMAFAQARRAAGYSLLSFLASLMFLSQPYHKYVWLFVGLAIIAERLDRDREPC
jgi:putative inorganic carbon (HCO3(-)) transporter